MSFQERLSQAVEWERRVRIMVGEFDGWMCEPFGQVNLTEKARSRLRLNSTPLRWMPDLLALHESGAAAILDAKTCRRDTPNWDVEINSIYSLSGHAALYEIPAFFVFQDWTVLNPTLARIIARNGITSDNGSGTAYVLIPKILCQTKLQQALNETLDAHENAETTD